MKSAIVWLVLLLWTGCAAPQPTGSPMDPVSSESALPRQDDAVEPQPAPDNPGIAKTPWELEEAAFRNIRMRFFTLHLLAGLYGEDYIVQKCWGGAFNSLDDAFHAERKEVARARRERILNPPIPSNAVIIEVRVVDPGRKYPAPTKTTAKLSKGKVRYLHEGRVLGYSIGEKDFPDLPNLKDHLNQLVTLGGNEVPPVILSATKDCIMGDLVPLLDAAVAASFTDIQFGGPFADNF